jgi:hypothetical protein
MPQIIEVPNYGNVEFPDDMSDEQIVAAIKKNLMGYKSADTAAPKNGIPRQLGLTARHLVEGGSDIVGTFSNPLAYLSNKALGTDLPTARSAVSGLLDYLNVPSPENATERVVGDASRLLVGTGTMLGAAKAGAKATQGATKYVLDAMQQAPALQASSAIGSGVAGGTTRESGGGNTAQFIASLAGGLGTPAMLYTGQKAVSGINNLANSFKPKPLTNNVDDVIKSAIKSTGLTMDDLAVNIKNQLREDIKGAMKVDGSLSPSALNRLVQYRLIGATPRGANLTFDPVEVTRLHNLTKMGANSKDPAMQELSRIQNSNASMLIDNLDNMGANTADDAYAAGQKVIGALEGRQLAAKKAIGSSYDKARATTGRYAEMDRATFANRANDLLDDAMLGGRISPDVRNRMNAISKGDQPFNVNYVEQFKTRIGELQRSSSDAAERKALGLVRQALDETPILSSEGVDSVAAFNSARRVNRAWRGIVEKTPALQAIEDGVQPDNFVKQFIIGSGNKSSVMDVAALKSSVKKSPEAMQAIRDQITAHLKKSAIGTGQDDAANFSQSAYRKAVQSIGDRKLNLFFDKSEVAKIKAIGDVAFAEQFRPTGSAVNESNSGALVLAGMLDHLGSIPLLRKIPLGAEVIGDPLRNAAGSMAARNALNLNGALVPVRQQLPIKPALFAPMATGLLSLPRSE